MSNVLRGVPLQLSTYHAHDHGHPGVSFIFACRDTPGSPESSLVHLGEYGGQGRQLLRFRLNIGRSERRRHRKSSDLMGVP